jgi:hypothetical protein
MASGKSARPKASAGPPKPSGKRAKKLSQKEQSERFIETARKLGSDETGTDFERAVAKVLSPQRKKPR